jgi:hypothetical protein
MASKVGRVLLTYFDDRSKLIVHDRTQKIKIFRLVFNTN